MEHSSEAARAALSPRERLIIALDVSTAAEARLLVRELTGAVGAFKIGLQLFTACGPDLVREIVSSDTKVFLDLKFHDIPNTVAGAAAEAARLGVWMFNVHASGGSAMMKRAADSVDKVCSIEQIPRPKVIGVTVLTSSNAETLRETGVESDVAKRVTSLAQLAAESGLDGVVASPQETGLIRNTIKREEFLIVTPGIRPILGTNDDQKRVMTLAAAIAAGSDYLVVGRPVTQAPDKLAAIEAMISGE